MTNLPSPWRWYRDIDEAHSVEYAKIITVVYSLAKDHPAILSWSHSLDKTYLDDVVWTYTNHHRRLLEEGR